MTDIAQRKAQDFLDLRIDTPSFGHREHVEIAFGMLEMYDFVEACTVYAATIRKMAGQHGAPEKYNATITFAFMSLIAERMSLMNGRSLDEFLAANPDLLDKDILMKWYSKDRLTSDRARGQFLLPDKAVEAAA